MRLGLDASAFKVIRSPASIIRTVQGEEQIYQRWQYFDVAIDIVGSDSTLELAIQAIDKINIDCPVCYCFTKFVGKMSRSHQATAGIQDY